MEKNKIIFIFILIIIFIFIYQCYLNKKKIGVIGLEHSQNVGNNLLKYAMFIKLSELGYSPFIVGRKIISSNISFIENNANIRLIKNFSEIKENEFDILMVNSDQTWRRCMADFFDVAFLKFAEHWNIKKFTYGTSFGVEIWEYNEEDEKIAKKLLKSFSGLSVREKSAIKLIEDHLGFKAQFVLDPTLLINKKHYINLIKNFRSEIINQTNNFNYIFSYVLMKTSTNIKNYLEYVQNTTKGSIFFLTTSAKNQVLEFLYGIINSKAVITDSFHGTVFSILFKKPFISFQKESVDSRFNSLDEIFNIKNRIFNFDSFPPISLLNQPLVINESKLLLLKKESINYLKKNLENSM